MITVVFYLDLTPYRAGHCDSHKNTAIQAIQKSIEGAGVLEAGIQMGAESFAVIPLPSKELTLAEILYWSNKGGLSYKTLWLNDVAEWRENGK